MNVVADDSSEDNDGTVGSTLSTDSLNADVNLIVDENDDNNHNGGRPPRFGRNTEESTLLDAFERVRKEETCRSEIVVVHGSKGTGKTSLVEVTLRVPVSKQGGYYVSGRFDQPPKQSSSRQRRHHHHHHHHHNANKQEPFHAISGALSDLCDLVVQSDDHDRDYIRNEMKKDGEKEANVLMQFVGGSAVTLLSDNAQGHESMASSSSTTTTTTTERRKQQSSEVRSSLKRACRKLLQALATPNHPVVLFLDNLHWADFASLDLIRYLIADSESTNILFVFAFRNDSGASLMKCLCRTARIHLPQQTLELENLPEDDAHRLVTQLLYQRQSSSVLTKTKSLSQAVFTKTRGNPRGTIRYLEKLERYGVLRRQRRSHGWVWDMERIQRHAQLRGGGGGRSRGGGGRGEVEEEEEEEEEEQPTTTSRRPKKLHPQLETCFRQLSTSYANILSKIESANDQRKRRQGAVSPSLQRGRPRTETH